jgi:hypothetical protein
MFVFFLLIYSIKLGIFQPENPPVGYYNRYTAISIVEPWVAHRMEHSLGPISGRVQSQKVSARNQQEK